MSSDVAIPKVLVLDDHPAVREGIKAMVEGSGRYVVAGLASSAGEARSALSAAREAGTPFDLVLADNNLKGQSGIDLVRECSASLKETRFIVVSVSVRFDTIIEAFAAGARGYFGKDQDEASLLRILDAVSRGELGIEGEALASLADNAVRLASVRMGLERSRYEELTPREREVFRLTALNKGVAETAEELGLSAKTVENMKSSIFGKLGLHDRFELYKYAVRIGIVED
jgi:two-component system response regulator NreC